MIIRNLALVAAMSAIAVAAAAQERFTLGLEDLVPGDDIGSVASRAPEGFGLSLDLVEAGHGPADDMVYVAALKPRTELEFRTALWSSPMGRLYYQREQQTSMLGREGLVNGGRMQGLGMATGAIGDGDPGGLQLLMRERSWKALTLGDKVKAGVEASFLGAILYYMAENFD